MHCGVPIPTRTAEYLGVRSLREFQDHWTASATVCWHVTILVQVDMDRAYGFDIKACLVYLSEFSSLLTTAHAFLYA